MSRQISAEQLKVNIRLLLVLIIFLVCCLYICKEELTGYRVVA